MLLDLANYESSDLVQHSLLLLDRYYTTESEVFEKALETQLLITDQSTELYNQIEGLILELAEYFRTGSESCQHQSSPIQELTQSCWLEGEVEGYEPHQINQNIILSFGKFSELLSYL